MEEPGAKLSKVLMATGVAFQEMPVAEVAGSRHHLSVADHPRMRHHVVRATLLLAAAMRRPAGHTQCVSAALGCNHHPCCCRRWLRASHLAC